MDGSLPLESNRHGSPAPPLAYGTEIGQRRCVFQGRFFLRVWSALTLALTASAWDTNPPLVVPSEDYSHGGGLEPPLFGEGRGTGRHSHTQSRKKKPMKKTNKLNQSSVPVQHSHTEKTPEAKAPQATPARTDERLPIDHEQRQANRKLDTAAVIAKLQDTRPDLYKRAVIVGSWVWLSFDGKPEATTRAAISQLGFHWNNTRQVWQHPCGKFTFGSKSDPRDTYTSKPAMEAFN